MVDNIDGTSIFAQSRVESASSVEAPLVYTLINGTASWREACDRVRGLAVTHLPAGSAGAADDRRKKQRDGEEGPHAAQRADRCRSASASVQDVFFWICSTPFD